MSVKSDNGMKDRVSANAGRFLVGWNIYDPDPKALQAAASLAIALEDVITAALRPQEKTDA